MRTLLLIFFIIAAAHVSADDKFTVAKKDSETGLWGYVNKEESGRTLWFQRAKRVSFGTLGIGGGSKNELLTHGYEDEWVISPQYENVAKEFSEGLAAVQLHGKVGYIDTLNRFVIEPKFESMKNLDGFSLGLAAVKINGKYGFIDKNGAFVIKPIYEYAENFRDNKLATVKQDGKFGAINLNGELVVPCKFPLEEAMTSVPFSNKPYREAKEQAAKDYAAGKYARTLDITTKAAAEADAKINGGGNGETRKITVKDENGLKSAYADDGSCVLSPIYDDIVPEDDNLLMIAQNGKWGVADAFGRIIIPAKYDIITYDDGASMIVADTGGRIGLYRTSGMMVLPPCLDGIDEFVDGKAIAYINYESGLVDTNGELTDSIVEKAFLKAVKMDESNAPRHEVTSLYNQILLACPDFAMAHNNIGIMDIEAEDYKEGMNRLKVAHKLEPENTEIAANLKQAKKDRNQRRWNRIGSALEVAAVVVGVATTAYTTVETIKHGSSGGGGGSMGAGDIGSGSGGGSSCAQILSEISRYENKLAKEAKSTGGKAAHEAGKNAAHRIAPDMVDGSTAMDLRVINSGKSLMRTYQKRIDELKRRARKKGCL